MDNFTTQVFVGTATATRMCLDPWSLVLIKANGDVQPCCYSKPIDSIMRTDLAEIITSKAMDEYRTGLLTGQLTISCQKCPARRKCSTEQLRLVIKKYFQTGQRVLENNDNR